MKKLEHAALACKANATNNASPYAAEHPFRVCLHRMGNRAQYALEVVQGFSNRLGIGSESLSEEEVERLNETQKWYFVSVLSVLEYSMGELLGSRGSGTLRDLAREGPFSKFLEQASSEGMVPTSERDCLKVLMRVRNDIVHRNAISKQSERYEYEGVLIELQAGKMIEGPFCMLADLGALTLRIASRIIQHLDS